MPPYTSWMVLALMVSTDPKPVEVPEVELLLAKLRTFREGIQNLRLTVGFQYGGELQIPLGKSSDRVDGYEWWQIGSTSRSHEICDRKGDHDELVRDGVASQFHTERGAVPVRPRAVILDTLSPKMRFYNFWYDALIQLPAEFDAALRRSLPPGGSPGISRVREGTRSFLVVKMSGDDGVPSEYWFDEGVGGLVTRRKRFHELDAGPAWEQSDVTEVEDRGAGVYFPKVVETREYEAAESGAQTPPWLMRKTFQNVEINKPIDPSVFDLAVAPGDDVIDQIKGVTYRAGVGGPASVVSPLERDAEPLRVDPVQRRSMRWLWPAGGMVAFVLLLALYLRRRGSF